MLASQAVGCAMHTETLACVTGARGAPYGVPLLSRFSRDD